MLLLLSFNRIIIALFVICKIWVAIREVFVYTLMQIYLEGAMCKFELEFLLCNYLKLFWRAYNF